MARALPSVGDMVRVHVVAKVVSIGAAGVDLATVAGATVHLAPQVRDDDGFAWEPEPVPEAVYVAGEAYRDAAGRLFLRNDTSYCGDRWTVVRADDLTEGQRVAEDRPKRPLQRLIPEGGTA